MVTHRMPCGRRTEYAQQRGLYDSVPGQPYRGPVFTDDGMLMRGPRDENIDGAFQSWHARRHGSAHTDPC